jgi:hypothetical protein
MLYSRFTFTPLDIEIFLNNSYLALNLRIEILFYFSYI